MSPTFSAAPQALGYLYQARVALFLLLQCPDEAVVKVEALDDIELIGLAGSAALDLTQLKHHLDTDAEITDHSPDLWKSIRVWADQITEKKFVFQDTRLFLVTTATAAKDSVASMLSPKNRDVVQAEARLFEVAKTSKNKALLASFDAFKKLTAAQRTALVSAITVITRHENIDEYKEKNRQHIRPAVRRQYVNSLYERLEGWWFDRVVRHLMKLTSEPYISAFELHEKIASIAEGFHFESLPIDFMNVDPDSTYLAESENKLFVNQLKALNVSPRIVGKAILDYYRAFEQRARWLDEGLVSPEELIGYERVLVDEWERYFDTVCGNLSPSLTNEDLIAHGLKVFRWAELEATRLKIRPRVEVDFVRRGSFHMLADKTPLPVIHWHPKFIETLSATISSAAGL